MKTLLIPALVTLTLVGCSSGPPTIEPEPQSAPEKADEAAGKGKDLSKLEHGLEYARAELVIAELKAASRLSKAEFAVTGAERKLDAATEELETFKGLEIPNEEEVAKLRVDRADHSRILAQVSNDELVRMFAKEDEASSEDAVLQKSTRELDMANRQYAQAQRAKSMKMDIEIPRKRRQLEWAHAQAEEGLASARSELETARLSTELELLRKRHAVEAAEKALAEAGGEAAAE